LEEGEYRVDRVAAHGVLLRGGARVFRQSRFVDQPPALVVRIDASYNEIRVGVGG